MQENLKPTEFFDTKKESVLVSGQANIDDKIDMSDLLFRYPTDRASPGKIPYSKIW